MITKVSEGCSKVKRFYKKFAFYKIRYFFPSRFVILIFLESISAHHAESSLSYADLTRTRVYREWRLSYRDRKWQGVLLHTTAYLVQLRVLDVIEATQKAGADRVAASSLAQLIAFQARHDR